MTGTRFSAAGFALLLASSQSIASERHDAVVDTDNGPVRGAVEPTTIAFRGIPFAEPPVGELRWRPPQPRGQWKGILDATQFGNHCLQPGTDQTNASEDCLFLNVYVPRRESEDGEAPRRPVMVWIYGGANASGASDFYDPTPLAEVGGVVVVSVNYRVGPFGFLAHPALDAEGHAAVNYGVMDQQLALTWVRNNIANFGGDSRNVTIFGESAGGLNVTTHLVAPLSAGLFDKAIIESGAYSLNTASLAASEARGTAFADRIGCTDQTAACLRSTSVDDVLANATGAYNQSTVDGQILPESQLSAIGAGRINRVPVIQGANSHEGRIFLSPNLTVAEYEASLTGYAAAAGRTPDEAFATYPLADYPSPFEALSAALGDFAFACSARRSNLLLAQWVPTYAYEFDDPAAGPLGPTHGAEIAYLMNVDLGDVLHGGPADLAPPSQRLSVAMREYWTNFARSSNPNSRSHEGQGEAREGNGEHSHLPRWEPTSPSIYDVQLMVAPSPHFDSTFGYGTRHHCPFWN